MKYPESTDARTKGKLSRRIVDALIGAGAWLLPVKPNKRALADGWHKTPATAKAVRAWAADGKPVGMIPGRSGLAVLDIDRAADGVTMDQAVAAVAAALGSAPLAVANTQGGGRHCFYRKLPASTVRNAKWMLPGAVDAGDVRGDKGYVVLWDADAALSAVRAVERADPVDVLALARKRPMAASNGAPSNGAALSGVNTATVLKRIREAAPGERNNTLNAGAFVALRRGQATVGDLIDAGLASGLEREEVTRTVESAREAVAKEDARTLPKSAAGFDAALEGLGVEMRFNVRAQRGEVRMNGAGAWTPPTATWAGWLQARIERRYLERTKAGGKAGPLTFGRETFARYRDHHLHVRQVDPFLEYLEGLPEWDGVNRLEGLGRKLFAPPSGGWPSVPLVNWVGLYMFLGPVQRARRPGCVVDETPVLVGPGDIGKSTFVRAIFAPEHAAAWFGEALQLDAPIKALVEALQGRVVVELTEMAGASRADAAKVKSFLSAREDGGVRLAYRADPTPTPRRALFVGTSDSIGHALPNDTNNRRFVAVELGGRGVHPREYMSDFRAQCWAEGVARFERGERANLPDALKPSQRTMNERQRIADSLEDVLHAIGDDALHGRTLAEIRAAVVADDDHGGREWAQVSDHRFGRALRHAGLGVAQRKRGGVKVRVWRRVGP